MSDDEKCIKPDHYCPSCKYGHLYHDDEGELNLGGMEKWLCLYDPEQPNVFAE